MQLLLREVSFDELFAAVELIVVVVVVAVVVAAAVVAAAVSFDFVQRYLSQLDNLIFPAG